MWIHILCLKLAFILILSLFTWKHIEAGAKGNVDGDICVNIFDSGYGASKKTQKMQTHTYIMGIVTPVFRYVSSQVLHIHTLLSYIFSIINFRCNLKLTRMAQMEIRFESFHNVVEEKYLMYVRMKIASELKLMCSFLWNGHSCQHHFCIRPLRCFDYRWVPFNRVDDEKRDEEDERERNEDSHKANKRWN